MTQCFEFVSFAICFCPCRLVLLEKNQEWPGGLIGIRRASPWPSMLSEPGVRTCSHDLSSIRTALQAMQGCTKESMELWLFPALVILFLACSDLITSASADSAVGRGGGQPSLASRKSCIPRTTFCPARLPGLPRKSERPRRPLVAFWPSLVRIHLVL